MTTISELIDNALGNGLLDSGESNFKDKDRLIGFKTNEEWNCIELQAFVTSVSDIYNILLAERLSEEKKIDSSQIYKNIEHYSKENQLLKVYRIKMGSPGGFSFQGLPGIIEQVRKTLDWWFHERSLNELKRAEECLDLVKKYLELRKLDNESEHVDELIKKFCKGIKIFEELESKGKLEKVIDNFDYMP
jgi:hypothetical protein